MAIGMAGIAGTMDTPIDNHNYAQTTREIDVVHTYVFSRPRIRNRDLRGVAAW